MWVCMLDRMVNCIYVVKLTLGMLIDFRLTDDCSCESVDVLQAENVST